jgi:hypothetical protein
MAEKYREIGGVREILAFPRGLTVADITMVFDGAPPNTAMQPALDAARERTYQNRVVDVMAKDGIPDHDGTKVWLKQVDFDGERLTLTTGQTSYFDLWGLPGAAPELHAKFLEELPNTKKTTVPNGIATHNTILTRDEHVTEVIGTIRSGAVGFSARRVSTTFEEQMEVEDTTPFRTVQRGLEEEYGALAEEKSIILLGLGAEKNTAYTAECHFVELDISAKELVESWRDAPDRGEGTTLLAIPLNKLEAFKQSDIPRAIWESRIIGGEVPATDTIQPHPVVPWRITLVQEHLSAR